MLRLARLAAVEKLYRWRCGARQTRAMLAMITTSAELTLAVCVVNYTPFISSDAHTDTFTIRDIIPVKPDYLSTNP